MVIINFSENYSMWFSSKLLGAVGGLGVEAIDMG